MLKRSPAARWMPQKWGPPGGRLEAGEHWADAAIRETYEETALKICNLRLLSIDKHVALYFCKTFEGNVKIDFEHTEWAWVERSNLSTYDTVPRLKELYELGMMYGNKEKN